MKNIKVRIQGEEPKVYNNLNLMIKVSANNTLI